MIDIIRFIVSRRMVKNSPVENKIKRHRFGLIANNVFIESTWILWSVKTVRRDEQYGALR